MTYDDCGCCACTGGHDWHPVRLRFWGGTLAAWRCTKCAWQQYGAEAPSVMDAPVHTLDELTGSWSRKDAA